MIEPESTEVAPDYHELIGYMKELRGYFHREYDTRFRLGKVYQGHPEYSYFSLTPEKLKPLKLKYVLILDHRILRFSICLSGQNKAIRKKWWNTFKERTFEKYKLVDSIDDHLFILDNTIVENPDFTQNSRLTARLEEEVVRFMEEMTEMVTEG